MAKTQIKGENVFDKSLKAIDIDISGATEKTTLVDNDSIAINDSADNLTKRSKLSTLLAYFTTIFQRKLLLQELSSLTDVIPTGFKGLFAKGSGIFWKNSDNTEKQIITNDLVNQDVRTTGTPSFETITANKITRVKNKTNSVNNNSGNPTVEEMALFLGQFSDKVRFAPPSIQEESTDGITWNTSSRLTTAQLKNLVIGQGNYTNVNVISPTLGGAGYYRLTWTAASYGYVTLSNLCIGCSTFSNLVNFKIEQYFELTTSWVEVASGNSRNYPGYIHIPHTEIAFWPTQTAGDRCQMIRITFSISVATSIFGLNLYGIEWYGGYPSVKRNIESIDSDKNVTYPAKLSSNEIINFDANIEPTQTGASVTKTSTWMWQYLTQGVKWIRANMLALGELSTNAYRGDRGKIAYDHSQVAHAPSTAEQNVNADWNAVSGDAQILNKPTIPAAQVQTDWNAATGMGVLLNKPASLPANGGNADTLDTLHAAVFARFNTAFTCWDNIPSNTPPVHVHVLDATGVLTYQDLYMVLGTNLSDTAPKVFVLQPGTYSISDIIDCSTANLVGIIGLSKHDTIIEIDCAEALTGLTFLENVTLLSTTEVFSASFVVSSSGESNTYIKSVDVICDDVVHKSYDFIAFQGFYLVENVYCLNIAGVCNECLNISGLTVNNSSLPIGGATCKPFDRCERISNVKISSQDEGIVFNKCTNISNVVADSGGITTVVIFDNCDVLTNCTVYGGFIAFNASSILSNCYAESSNTGFYQCSQISNSKVLTIATNGFDECNKISSCKAELGVSTGFLNCNKISVSEALENTDVGFDSCTGLVNNISTGSTTNYSNCYADMAASYAVADTPSGGFNT